MPSYTNQSISPKNVISPRKTRIYIPRLFSTNPVDLKEILRVDWIGRIIVTPVVYVLLKVRGTAYTMRGEPVEYEGIILTPSMPTNAPNNHEFKVPRYQLDGAYCNLWWRWFSTTLSKESKTFKKFAEGWGELPSETMIIDKSRFALISAFEIKADFDEAVVGSLYVKSYGWLYNEYGPLHNKRIGFKKLMKFLKHHLDESYNVVEDPKNVLDVISRMIPDGWEIELDEFESGVKRAVERSLEALKKLTQYWLVTLEYYSEGELRGRGLAGGKEGSNLILTYSLATEGKERIMEMLERQYNYYTILERRYRTLAHNAEAFSATSFFLGNLGAWYYFEGEKNLKTSMAEEARRAREAIVTEYYKLLREMEYEKLLEVPLVVDPEKIELKTSFIVFPVITGVELKGVRRQGVMRDIVMTPDGIGIVWTTFSQYTPYMPYSINTVLGINELSENKITPCAYGDGLVEISDENKENICSKCGVPLCVRHRRIVIKEILFIKRIRTYCPEHLPKSSEWYYTADPTYKY